jgi:hypothetical protein
MGRGKEVEGCWLRVEEGEEAVEGCWVRVEGAEEG